MKLSKTQFTGLLRHFLTFIGGVLLTMGYLDAESIEMASGAVMTLVGVVLSAINKKSPDSEEPRDKN